MFKRFGYDGNTSRQGPGTACAECWKRQHADPLSPITTVTGRREAAGAASCAGISWGPTLFNRQSGRRSPPAVARHLQYSRPTCSAHARGVSAHSSASTSPASFVVYTAGTRPVCWYLSTRVLWSILSRIAGCGVRLCWHSASPSRSVFAPLHPHRPASTGKRVQRAQSSRSARAMSILHNSNSQK